MSALIQKRLALAACSLLFTATGYRGLQAQPAGNWHGIERTIHYKPVGNDFGLVNGHRKFNRALYGSNTAFRVEAGDLPEFAMYMPGMGGNLKLGFIYKDQSKWITAADSIRTVYVPGKMAYEIRDNILGKAVIRVNVLALAGAEGMVLEVSADGLPAGAELAWVYGGATGKKFSRDGDIGADPESSFYLKPEYCADNIFSITKNSFELLYGFKKALSDDERYEVQHLPGKDSASVSGSADPGKKISGIFPDDAKLLIANAAAQTSPATVFASTPANGKQMLAGRVPAVSGKKYYLLVQKAGGKQITYKDIPAYFDTAEAARKKLAGRITLQTPDPYINPMAGALAMAADGIWEEPSYMHGAIAWRMRLPAWRGAYVADPLGWHDRARMHFSSYAKSQVTSPLTGPVVADTALHIARQLEKMGTSMFSSGYISRNPNGDLRPHHYDMNLVFIDQLLSHFNWTGDTAYVREMWPLLERHLAWEKRNYDADGDGLYDAYCAIWASDALQYSGGGVTHSSAYNYSANKTAAQLAALIGKDGSMYQQEADKIFKAVQKTLWLSSKGWFAEFKDLLGNKMVHDVPALWSIYHALDEGLADPFQSYQNMRYVDKYIPRIPIKAGGLPPGDWYTLSTSNWQPYTWSLNNVALGELLHTSLAYWQSGRHNDAFKLWKSSMLESLYMSASPGGFEQLSFYDAVRGELYRDFADPVGMAARTLVEGLFGIQPAMLNNELLIKPGFPSDWKQAAIGLPDISLNFNETGSTTTYTIVQQFRKKLAVKLQLPARSTTVQSVTVNGKKAKWHWLEQAVGTPVIAIDCSNETTQKVVIVWGGIKPGRLAVKPGFLQGETITLNAASANILEYFDPQHLSTGFKRLNDKTIVLQAGTAASGTIFVKLSNGDCKWWQPLPVDIQPAVELQAADNTNGDALSFSVINHTGAAFTGRTIINRQSQGNEVKYDASAAAHTISIPPAAVIAGSNRVAFSYDNGIIYKNIINWDLKNPAKMQYEPVQLRGYLNAGVTQIFKNKYMSPRPVSTTLQLPWQGIGNWCYPVTDAAIDDAGLRRAAVTGTLQTPFGVPFNLLPDSFNIAFASQWDNYPDSVLVPLSGNASHVYLLMAGSTNPMQSRVINGSVTVSYTDGSTDILTLKNPENWYPIEQDYISDGFAFTTDAPRPWRVLLKTGEVTKSIKNFYTIKGYSNRGIDGGAATILDLPLDKAKTLHSLTVKAVANDVVIGLMAATLVR